MRHRLLQALVVVAACATVTAPAFGAWLDRCTTARLIASWKHDGFWRTWQVYGRNYPDGNRLRFVGKLRAGGRSYGIYYDDSGNPETEAHHGHQDLVVTSASGRFLGLYNLDDPESEPTRIEGMKVLFPPRKDVNGGAYRNSIEFGPKGPPAVAPLLFGYDVTFGTPSGFRGDFPERGPRVAAYCRR